MLCSFLLYNKVIQISLGWEAIPGLLEQGMAIHSSILAWRIPWTEELGGLHFVCVLVPQSCPTLCGPMDGSPPGSSVHGILQARILEWVALSFSMGIFLTQELNPGLLNCRQILYWLSCEGSLSFSLLLNNIWFLPFFSSLQRLEDPDFSGFHQR